MRTSVSRCFPSRIVPFQIGVVAGLFLVTLCVVQAIPAAEPKAADATARKPATIFVSKLGDNTDGSSWQKAFHTIQAGVQAVPDDQGGHRVLVRPDTYVEANIYTNHSGAAGAYNAFIGDVDGSLGSGTTGWVVIDASCPGVAVRMDLSYGEGNPPFKIIKSDLPESGLKCVDWWGPFRGDPSFSMAIWDRWEFRGLYLCGSEGGIGWDMIGKNGCEFSAIVDNCVGVGRFAGACVGGHIARKDEPVIFRHSYFMNLDLWGDAGGVYVRAHETSMPDYPDAVFEDCTIVSPDNALQVGYPKFDLYTRVKFKDCRMIVLNFSQPRGTPSSGIVCCDTDEKHVRVDFEDCQLMGYKVFGKSRQDLNKVDGTGTGLPSYSVKGTVEAYVQFEQPLPEGFERLGLWPTELFKQITPPSPDAGKASATRTGLIAPAKP